MHNHFHERGRNNPSKFQYTGVVIYHSKLSRNRSILFVDEDVAVESLALWGSITSYRCFSRALLREEGMEVRGEGGGEGREKEGEGGKEGR